MFLLVPIGRNGNIRPVIDLSVSDPICPLKSKNIVTCSIFSSVAALESFMLTVLQMPWQKQLQHSPNYCAFPFSARYLTWQETNI
jgi:hypothetical protein